MNALYLHVKNSVSAAFDLSGGMHWGLAPSGTKPEYLVMRPSPGGSYDTDTGTQQIGTQGIIFQFFAFGLTRTSSLVKSLQELFFGISANIDPDLRIIDANLGSEDVFLDPDREDDASEVWQGLVSIDFTVQRRLERNK